MSDRLNHLIPPIVRSAIVAAIAALSTMVAASVAPAQQWQGRGIVVTASGCDGYRPGSDIRVRYRAPLGTASGEFSYTTFEGRYAQGFRWQPGGAPLAFADAVSIGGSFGTFRARIRQISRTPAQLSATTPFVNLVLQIVGIDDQPSCNVTINHTLTLRIEPPPA